MKKYESQRGAILLESALIVGAIFMMLFGTVYLAMIGFDQISADGASYEVAHQTSVQSSAPPQQVSHNLYPNIPQAQISAVLAPAPASSISVDYGYNDASQSVRNASNNDRHGGVSIMQGTEVSGSATKKSASILGMPISVVGDMVEPMWLENGIHFNAENTNGYGSTSAQCATPPTPGPTPTPNGQTPPPSKCFSGNVFTSGENTPPYFVGYDLMTHCLEKIPWSTGNGNGSTAPPAPFINQPDGDCTQTLQNGTVTSGDEGYTPLGVAEYLDLNNWCGSTSSDCSNAPANPGIAGSKSSDSTFAFIACHQRVYAAIAQWLNDTSVYPHNNLQDVYNQQGGFSATTGAAPAYYYYNIALSQQPQSTPGKAPLTAGSNSLTIFAGFDSTYTQEQAMWPNPSPTSAAGPMDTLIRQVYSWDGNDSGTNSTNPGNGC